MHYIVRLVSCLSENCVSDYCKGPAAKGPALPGPREGLPAEGLRRGPPSPSANGMQGATGNAAGECL